MQACAHARVSAQQTRRTGSGNARPVLRGRDTQSDAFTQVLSLPPASRAAVQTAQRGPPRLPSARAPQRRQKPETAAAATAEGAHSACRDSRPVRLVQSNNPCHPVRAARRQLACPSAPRPPSRACTVYAASSAAPCALSCSRWSTCACMCCGNTTRRSVSCSSGTCGSNGSSAGSTQRASVFSQLSATGGPAPGASASTPTSSGLPPPPTGLERGVHGSMSPATAMRKGWTRKRRPWSRTGSGRPQKTGRRWARGTPTSSSIWGGVGREQGPQARVRGGGGGRGQGQVEHTRWSGAAHQAGVLPQVW